MAFVSERDYAAKGLMRPSFAKSIGMGKDIDFYKTGTGDKANGRVHKNDGRDVHVHEFLNGSTAKTRLHKFKVQEHLPESANEMTAETLTESELQYVFENMTVAEYLQLDELSKDTLRNYIAKASKPKNTPPKGKVGYKRDTSIAKAVTKITQ